MWRIALAVSIAGNEGAALKKRVETEKEARCISRVRTLAGPAAIAMHSSLAYRAVYSGSVPLSYPPGTRRIPPCFQLFPKNASALLCSPNCTVFFGVFVFRPDGFLFDGCITRSAGCRWPDSPRWCSIGASGLESAPLGAGSPSCPAALSDRHL